MKYTLLSLLLFACTNHAIAEISIKSQMLGDQEDISILIKGSPPDSSGDYQETSPPDTFDITINKKDHKRLMECGNIKSEYGRYHCAQYYINPWDHHIEFSEREI